MPETDTPLAAWIAAQLANAPQLTDDAAQRVSRILFGESS